jgi:hypothetical protein
MPRQTIPTAPGEFRAVDDEGNLLGGRGPRTYVHWYGGRVLAGLEVATMNVVRNVTRAAADIARHNHPWQNRTGQLEASVFAAEPEFRGDHIYALWGAHWPALYLEYGTVKMDAYPFLRPAAAEAYKLAHFAGAIRGELSGSSGLSMYLM